MLDKPFTVDSEFLQKARAEGWRCSDWVAFSREDLYDRTWSTPARTLAAELGISDWSAELAVVWPDSASCCGRW